MSERPLPPEPSKPKKQVHRKTKAGRLVSDIQQTELQAWFQLPEHQACRRMGLGLTVFKRVCRRFGVRRWPYRKLQRLKHVLKKVEAGFGTDNNFKMVENIVRHLGGSLSPKCWGLVAGSIIQACSGLPQEDKLVAAVAQGMSAASDNPEAGAASDGDTEDDEVLEAEEGSDSRGVAAMEAATTGPRRLPASSEQHSESHPWPPPGAAGRGSPAAMCAGGGAGTSQLLQQASDSPFMGLIAPPPQQQQQQQVPGLDRLLAAVEQQQRQAAAGQGVMHMRQSGSMDASTTSLPPGAWHTTSNDPPSLAPASGTRMWKSASCDPTGSTPAPSNRLWKSAAYDPSALLPAGGGRVWKTASYDPSALSATPAGRGAWRSASIDAATLPPAQPGAMWKSRSYDTDASCSTTLPGGVSTPAAARLGGWPGHHGSAQMQLPSNPVELAAAAEQLTALLAAHCAANAEPQMQQAGLPHMDSTAALADAMMRLQQQQLAVSAAVPAVPPPAPAAAAGGHDMLQSLVMAGLQSSMAETERWLRLATVAGPHATAAVTAAAGQLRSASLPGPPFVPGQAPADSAVALAALLSQRLP